MTFKEAKNQAINEALALTYEYYAAGITDADFLKKRFLSLLHDRLFFSERGEVRPEMRKYFESKIDEILGRMGLHAQDEDGRITRFKGIGAGHIDDDVSMPTLDEGTTGKINRCAGIV